MARVTVEDCLDNVDNRFALVLLATGRARMLMRGAHSLVVHEKNKEPVLALREIAAGKVHFDKNVRVTIGTPLLELRAQYEDVEAV